MLAFECFMVFTGYSWQGQIFESFFFALWLYCTSIPWIHFVSVWNCPAYSLAPSYCLCGPACLYLVCSRGIRLYFGIKLSLDVYVIRMSTQWAAMGLWASEAEIAKHSVSGCIAISHEKGSSGKWNDKACEPFLSLGILAWPICLDNRPIALRSQLLSFLI